jgi:hypothetical protein
MDNSTSARIITNVLVGLAQLWLGGSLAGWLGRLWALRISICIMIVGVYEVVVIPGCPELTSI